MGRALIVVDVQVDFCEGGSLAVGGGAAVARAITSALEEPGASRWDLVIATRDWHVDPGAHFAGPDQPPDYAETWPVHCVAGSPGAEFHPALHLPGRAVPVVKGEYQAAYSGFDGHDPSGRSLAQVLNDAGVAQVDVAGIATSFCVRATAVDAVGNGYDTAVLTELCADVDPGQTAATLGDLAAAGVAVTTLASRADRAR